MSEYTKYPHFGRIDQLKNEGRELLGKDICWTVKRDGQNIVFWHDGTEVRFGSRNMEVPDQSIISKVTKTPEYSKVVALLEAEPQLVVYCEHMQSGRGPCKIEMPRKKESLILLDILNSKGVFFSYNLLHQYAHKHKLPVAEMIEQSTPMTLKELFDVRDQLLIWCKKHKKEGVVGKVYYQHEQIFFKEKIDLPKKPLKKTRSTSKPSLPTMPEEKIWNAISQAEEECKRNGEAWNDPKYAMPRVARHLATQAREHCYATPTNMFSWYTAYKNRSDEG